MKPALTIVGAAVIGLALASAASAADLLHIGNAGRE